MTFIPAGATAGPPTRSAPPLRNGREVVGRFCKPSGRFAKPSYRSIHRWRTSRSTLRPEIESTNGNPERTCHGPHARVLLPGQDPFLAGHVPHCHLHSRL